MYPGHRVPGQKGYTMLALTFLAAALLYGLAAVAFEEATR